MCNSYLVKISSGDFLSIHKKQTEPIGRLPILIPIASLPVMNEICGTILVVVNVLQDFTCPC